MMKVISTVIKVTRWELSSVGFKGILDRQCLDTHSQWEAQRITFQLYRAALQPRATYVTNLVKQVGPINKSKKFGCLSRSFPNQLSRF